MCKEYNLSEFLDKTSGAIKIKTFTGEEKEYKLLKEIAFNSDTKRSTCILQNLQTQKYFVYCKGADTEIVKILKDKDSERVKKDYKNIDNYACRGLRTLAFSMKEIDQATIDQLKALDFEEKQTDAIVCKDLEFLGATSVEDLIAEDVEKCIKDFREAGISVWMLTGDKGETAKEIAISCNLLSRDQVHNLIEIQEGEDWRIK